MTSLFSFRFHLAWKKERRKLYVHTPSGNCLHFGRLIGRWSYGFDRLEPDPYGELEG